MAPLAPRPRAHAYRCHIHVAEYSMLHSHRTCGPCVDYNVFGAAFTVAFHINSAVCHHDFSAQIWYPTLRRGFDG